MTITQLFPRDGGLNVITGLRQRVDIVRAALWRAPTSQADCERVHQLAIAAEDALFELALGLSIDPFEETERRVRTASSAVELLERSVLRCAPPAAPAASPSAGPTPIVGISPMQPNAPRPFDAENDERLCVVHFVDGTTRLVDTTDAFFHVTSAGVTLPRYGGDRGAPDFAPFHPWAVTPAVRMPDVGVSSPSPTSLMPDVFLYLAPLLAKGLGKLFAPRNRPRFARLEVTRLDLDAARIEFLVSAERHTADGMPIYDVIFSAPVVLPRTNNTYNYHFLVGTPAPGIVDPLDPEDGGEEDELDPPAASPSAAPAAVLEPVPETPVRDRSTPRGPNVAEKN